MNEALNIDCMEYMKAVPDKWFDLCVVDPPYGGGSQNGNVEREREAARRIRRLGKPKTEQIRRAV